MNGNNCKAEGGSDLYLVIQNEWKFPFSSLILYDSPQGDIKLTTEYNAEPYIIPCA